MPYQVLARKYRPQRFSDVVGQDHVTRTLLNALAQNRIAHGYIFSGHRGIGKTTIARILAMALNCATPVGSPQRPTHEPCLACTNCREISSASRQESSVFEESHSFDVEEIDAATNRGIDDARLLTSKIQARPTNNSKYRIIILDEAHQITDAAWNALLKTLEEPPEWAVFMFATTQAEDIPQTIRSRCQHFTFHAVKFEAIVEQLRSIAVAEHIAASDETLALLAEAGDGSMRDALSIMDQAIASAVVANGALQLDAAQIRELMGAVPNAVFERLLTSISENQSAPVIEEVNRLLNAGNSASQLARQFTRYLRNTLMARLAGEQSELLQLSPDERARVARSAALFSEEDLTRFLQVMLRTFDELNYRQEPRFHLELGLIKLVHLQRLLPVEQLLSQLGAAPSPATPALTKSTSAALPTAIRNTAAAAPPLSTASTSPPASSASISKTASSAPASPAPLSLHAAAATQPASSAFSPFEQDRHRKTYDRSLPDRVEQSQSPNPPHAVIQSAAQELRLPSSSVAALLPAAKEERAASKPPASPAPVPPADKPATEQPPAGQAEMAVMLSEATDLPLPPSVAEHPSTPEQQATGPTPEPQGWDTLRDRITEALDNAGHNTAAALLANGTWSEHEGVIRVEVAAKKTMLGLAMNQEAEKICRETIRAIEGRALSITFIPDAPASASDSARASNAAARPAASGSAQARALENPLVQQAKELFRAEVRTVLDLRKP